METDPEVLLRLVWSAGWLGKSFLVSAALALAALAVVTARAKFVLSLNTRLFVAMVEKLMAAGNADRAYKLTSVHDGPVAKLLRLGLHKRQNLLGLDAAERARKVEAELQRELPGMLAFAQRGVALAQVLAGVAMSLGVVAAVGPASEAVVGCGAVVLALLAGFVTTVRQGLRFRRDLALAAETLVRLVKVEALG